MSETITMHYGDYEFSPVPIVSINRNSTQVKNRENPIAYTFSMSISGTLIAQDPSGLTQTEPLMDELRSAFNRDGKRLLIACNGLPVMIIYPRISTISFAESNNNWVETIPYTIELEYDHDYGLNEHPANEIPPYIESYSEEWQCEFSQENRYFNWDLSSITDQRAGWDYSSGDQSHLWEARVTHTINIVGKQSWAPTGSGGGTGTGIGSYLGDRIDAVDNAMAFLTDILKPDDPNSLYSYDGNFGHGLTGWTNLIPAQIDELYDQLDHFRSHSINETDGSVGLTENWIILGDNSGIALPANKRSVEDFTVEIRTGIDNPTTSVSVQGSIQGYEYRRYEGSGERGTNVEATAYDSASNTWGILQDRIFPRAQYIFEGDSGFGRLNPEPMTKSVGHNPGKGTINYSYDFNNRPCAFVTGALSENFTIVDNNPSDVFAKLSVLGRAAGPVLQEISTVTEAVREVTIEAVMPTPTGCDSITDLDLFKPDVNVGNLLCEFEQQLTGTYLQVFKNSDSENWNPLSGRYNRTVSWTYQSCSGWAPDTSMCS